MSFFAQLKELTCVQTVLSEDCVDYLGRTGNGEAFICPFLGDC